MSRGGWGLATAVVAIALIAGPGLGTAVAADRAKHGASASSVRLLKIYYQSPVLVKAGERVMIPVHVVCVTGRGTPCDATLSLGARAGVGDVWRFGRSQAAAGLTFDVTAAAARAASSHAGQSVDFAFQAESGGLISSLPASGTAPLKIFATRAMRTIRVPAVPFGRVRKGATVLTLAWGSGPKRAGLELGREAATLGPSAFDVDGAGQVYLLDALQGRVARFRGARLVRQWAVRSEPSSDLAVAGDGTIYVSRRVDDQLMVARRSRSGRDVGTVSLGPAMLSQLKAGASDAFAEVLPLDAWTRVPARGLPTLAPIAGRPMGAGQRLLRVGTERFVRLGLVRRERVHRAVELRSDQRFGEVALAETDGSGGYVVVVRVWRATPAADQFQVIHLSRGRLVESFAVSSRAFTASPPLARFRLGRDGRLYQLVTKPSGIRIVRFDLEGES